jgi:hypothetical protein
MDEGNGGYAHDSSPGRKGYRARFNKPKEYGTDADEKVWTNEAATGIRRLHRQN